MDFRGAIWTGHLRLRQPCASTNLRPETLTGWILQLRRRIPAIDQNQRIIENGILREAGNVRVLLTRHRRTARVCRRATINRRRRQQRSPRDAIDCLAALLFRLTFLTWLGLLQHI